jgi:phage shock protein B
MNGAQIIGLVAVVMALSIPILGIYAGIMKSQYRQRQTNVSDEEREQLQQLSRTAETLATRIATLESILDSEVPDWRDDHEQQ